MRRLASSILSRAINSCRPLTTLMLLLSGLSVCAQTPPSRPILFVHGWCGSAYDWAPLYSPLFATLPGSMYPDQTVYYVLYDSVANTIHFWSENAPSAGVNGMLSPIEESTIPSSA